MTFSLDFKKHLAPSSNSAKDLKKKSGESHCHVIIITCPIRKPEIKFCVHRTRMLVYVRVRVRSRFIAR